MKTHKPMSEINRIKWARMSLIMERLKEHPMTIHEVESLVRKSSAKITKRTIQNYLAELRALILVTYNVETRTYELVGVKKRIFQSKHDYDIALKHSKMLVFSTREKQRFDLMDPYLALDLLAFYDLNEFSPDIDDKCVVEHLRTGYFTEVYSLLMKYRELMDKHGFSKISSLPKLYHPQSNKLSSGSPEQMVTRVATFKNTKVEDRLKTKEIDNLRNLLVGKIYSIMNDVRNGIPLQGYCEYCPSQRLTVKGKR